MALSRLYINLYHLAVPLHGITIVSLAIKLAFSRGDHGCLYVGQTSYFHIHGTRERTKCLSSFLCRTR